MKYIYTLIFALLAFASCNSDEDKVYYFIGDQMLDNMDIDAAFPTKNVVDCSLSGRHLEDMMANPIRVPSDGVAVVLLGMHDIGSGASFQLTFPNYYSDYEQMVKSLGAGRTIVIGMIPSQNALLNQNYFAFNREMKGRFEAYENIDFVDVTYRLVDEETELLEDQYARHDGLLLNDYGYQVLAEEIKKYL